MGTPALAAHILERLTAASADLCRVAAVVTGPDQPRGRGLKREPTEVATVASRHGLPVLKPAKIRTPEFLADLRAFAPDLLIVAAYGRILPNPVLVRDMIFRGRLPAEVALEVDRDFEAYLGQFGELQKLGQRILERLVQQSPQR